jgi:hypothetical protein
MTTTDDYLQSILRSVAKLQKTDNLGEFATELDEVDEILADIADRSEDLDVS